MVRIDTTVSRNTAATVGPGSGVSSNSDFDRSDRQS